jgi:hypothetical protein
VKLPPEVADKVAAAFAHTFWWAVATILIAFVPTLFLPHRAAKVTPPEAPDVAEGDAEGLSPVAGAILD